MLLNRSYVCLLALCAVCISFTGCRNRCQQPCGYPYQQPFQQQFPNQFGFNNAIPNYGQQNPALAGRSPVIAPPATGSINIPSLARNNPFGTNRGLLNTGQAAPTPANRSARFNQQNGWQGVGDGSRPTSPQSNIQSGQGTTNNQGTRTTLGSNSTLGTGQNAAQGAPSAARSVLVQDTQSRPAGYGDSYVRSPNYATTSVNETNDRTRLPATDASGVRAPSQYYTRASGVQVAQLPAQGTFGAAQPYYSGTFQGNPAQYNSANFNVASGTVQPGGRPVGVFASNSNSNFNRAIVQGQSTVTLDPYGNTRSADWRNRDVSSGAFQ